MPLLLVALGILGIAISGAVTRQAFNRSGLPTELLEHTAGTGLVPKWASALNLLGWGLLLLGGLGFLLHW